MAKFYEHITAEERERITLPVMDAVACANKDMAQLFQNVATNFDRRALVIEAGGVLRALCGVADILSIDLQAAARDRITGVGFLLLDMSLGKEIEATTLAANANIYMAQLVHSSTLNLNRSIMVRDLGRIAAMLERFIEVLGGSFSYVIEHEPKKVAHG